MSDLNFEKVVVILRGVSGCGKTTFAKYLKSLFEKDYERDCVICCADDYFTKPNGEYVFDGSKISEAHENCRAIFIEALKHKASLVCVANTNATEKEFQFYLDEAKRVGYVVFSMVLENRNDTKNVHGVCSSVLEKQATRIENSLKLI